MQPDALFTLPDESGSDEDIEPGHAILGVTPDTGWQDVSRWGSAKSPHSKRE